MTRPGAWVQQSFNQSPMGSTAPQSGHSASLDVSGFVGVIAYNSTPDAETFIRRLVESMQGRVLDLMRLREFANTWVQKAKYLGSDIERVRPVYDEMVSKMQSDAQMPGAWLQMPQQSLGGASPQSGQAAVLNANGLAGAVASGNPMDVETFIGRVISYLNCSIVDNHRFTNFVSTWSNATRQQNCDPIRVRSVYEDMIAQIRRDAQTPGQWVTMQRSPMSASPQSGDSAPLQPSGLAGVVAAGNPMEVERFMSRVVESSGCRVMDQRKLQEYASRWSQMVRDARGEDSRLHNIYQDLLSQISRDAQMPGGWVALQNGASAPSSTMPPPLGAPQALGVRASPQSGQIAKLDEHGLAGTVAGDNSQEVQKFVGRLAVELGFQVKAFDGVQRQADDAMAKVKAVNCEAARSRTIFEEMKARIRADAATPGSWVKDPKAGFARPGMGLSPPAPPPGGGLGGGGQRASPESGQKAPMSAAGWAATVAYADANNKPAEVEFFIGRLIHDLGLRTTPGKYDTQKRMAAHWAAEVRAQNCVVDRVGQLYDNMVNRIRQDAQRPGEWVHTGSGTPVSSPTLRPAGSAFGSSASSTPPAMSANASSGGLSGLGRPPPPGGASSSSMSPGALGGRPPPAPPPGGGGFGSPPLGPPPGGGFGSSAPPLAPPGGGLGGRPPPPGGGFSGGPAAPPSGAYGGRPPPPGGALSGAPPPPGPRPPPLAPVGGFR